MLALPLTGDPPLAQSQLRSCDPREDFTENVGYNDVCKNEGEKYAYIAYENM